MGRSRSRSKSPSSRRRHKSKHSRKRSKSREKRSNSKYSDKTKERSSKYRYIKSYCFKKNNHHFVAATVIYLFIYILYLFFFIIRKRSHSASSSSASDVSDDIHVVSQKKRSYRDRKMDEVERLAEMERQRYNSYTVSSFIIKKIISFGNCVYCAGKRRN